MNERRFKIGMISMHIVGQCGKELGKQIQKAIPEEAIVLKQQEDFERASVAILIYHPKFNIVADGEKVPRIQLDIELPEAKDKRVILPYQH